MLRTSNVDEISMISSITNPLNTRLKRECQSIRANYDNISVEICNSDILVSLNRKNNNYIFNIPNNYPFAPPRLTINGVEQQHFFKLNSCRFKSILKYISGLDCLCCNSYLCKANWGPILTMNHIIEQIENYKNIKHNIFIKISLDKIKDKYLNRNIDLDSWLFNVHEKNLCYTIYTNH